MLSVRRYALAFGLFLFGLGISLFAVGGAGIATGDIVKASFRGGRTLAFLIVVGLSILAVGSVLVAYSFKQTAPAKSDGSAA